MTLIAFLGIHFSAFAGTLYWIGSANNAAPSNWTDVNSWSTTAGGAAGVDIPNGTTFADVVFSQNAAVVFTAAPTDLGTLTVNSSATVRFMSATNIALFATTPTVLSIALGSKLELVTSATSGTAGGLNLNVRGTCTIDGTLDLLGGSGSRLTQAASNAINVSGTIRSGNILVGGTASNAGTFSLAGTLNMNANSNFIVAKTFASAIPAAVWDATPTLTINDLSAASAANTSAISWPTAANTSLGNFVWNCPAQAASVATGFQTNSGGHVATVKGDFTITSSNGKTVPMSGSNIQTKTTIFKGDFTSATAAQIDMMSSFASSNSGGPTWQFEKNVLIGGPLSNGANTGTSTISFIGSNTGLGGSSAQTFSCGLITANKINLIVNNSGNGLTPLSTMGVFKNVTCSSGKIPLGSFSMTAAGLAAGSSSGGWIVTDGTGTLTILGVGTSGKLFPVGTSATSFDGMAIMNTVGTNDFTVSVKPSFTNAPADVAKTCQREWNVVSTSTSAAIEMLAGSGAACPAAVNVIGHYVGGAWVESAATIGAYNGWSSATFTSFSPFGTGAACGFGTTSPANLALASGDWTTNATWTCGVIPTATTAVTIAGAATVVALNVANPTVQSLAFMNGGKLQLGANDMTVTMPDVLGDATMGYVITDGAGKLNAATLASVPNIFPIGVSATSYDPLSITPTAAVNFAAKVSATITNPLSANGSNKDLIVSREWDMTPASAPGSTALVFTASATALNASGTAFDFNAPTAGLMGHWNATLNAGAGAWEAYPTAYSSVNRAWTIAAYTGTYSPFVIASSSAVLAVEFTAINAQAKSITNVINFATASEKGVKEFAIERSTNNKTWETIGTKAAIGGAVAATYGFEDKSPAPLSYYRVWSIETDGKSQTSKVVAVKRNGGKLTILAVFPMPYTEGSSVDVEVGKSATVSATVTDIVGRVVHSERFKTTEGANNLRLNLSNLTNGSYILTLNDGETMASQRIMKQ